MLFRSKRGLVTMASSHAVCIVHYNRLVYFGIPGAGDDWIEVHSIKLSADKPTQEVQEGLKLVAAALKDTNTTWDKDWLDTYKANPIKDAHPDYVRAVLASHKAFTGKDWK